MSEPSFIPERQLAFSPALAQAIGLEEAVLLQHLGGLFEHRPTQRRKGRDWLQVERAWLLRTLPFWSSVDLHRVSRSLADKGLILVDSPPLHDSESLVFALNQLPSGATEARAADGAAGLGQGIGLTGRATGGGIGPSSGAGLATEATGGAVGLGQGTGLGGRASLLGPAWTPSEDLLQLLALNHAIPRQFAIDQLEEFVLYWRERGEAHHAWGSKFRQHVLNRWRQSEQAQAQASLTQDQTPAQTPTGLTQSPNGLNQPPAGLTQPPTGLTQSPNGLNQPPTGLNQPPTGLTQTPAGLSQPPTGLTQPPTGLNQPPTERFIQPAPPITGDWHPSADALEILERAGINRAFIDDAVPEFVLYWRERNPQEKALNAKFVQHIRHQWARYTSSLTHDTTPHRMPADWQPTEDVFDILRLCHIDAQFARQLIPEFVLYWKETNKHYKSWNTKFLQHVKYQWAKNNALNTNGGQPGHEQGHEGQQGHHRAGRTRDRSLTQDLNDRSWAH